MTIDEIHEAIMSLQIMCPEKKYKVNLRHCYAHTECFCDLFEALTGAEDMIEIVKGMMAEEVAK